MKKTYVIANWKENKTASQTTEWFEKFSIFNFQFSNETEIVICPPSVLLPALHSSLSSANPSLLYLGAQDVSKFEEGPHTGEVSAKMLKDFVDYVIVGHSERRKHFHETNEDVQLKVEQCLKYNLTPIVCVSNLEQVSRCQGVKVSQTIFVYEPVEHISTEGEFRPDDPEHANSMAKKIKAEVGQDVKVLYGGSVNAENAKSFVRQSDISGILVGQASLDAEEFAKIVNSL